MNLLTDLPHILIGELGRTTGLFLATGPTVEHDLAFETV